jgi:argininosuccinate lyase
VFTLLKGLPLTYNRDLQEDKEPLFHAVGTAKDAVSIMGLCIKGMSVNSGRMEKAVYDSFMPAVELAEYLTLKGIPFRRAHGIVGKLVRDCEDKGKKLRDLKVEDLFRGFRKGYHRSHESFHNIKQQKNLGSCIV